MRSMGNSEGGHGGKKRTKKVEERSTSGSGPEKGRGKRR